jgi:thiamine-phosphate pyrophosphorylase
VSLPDPPLLVITDRNQAAKPLPEMLDAVFAAGCRWASVREKDLPPSMQVALAKILLPIARLWHARLTLHGDPALAKAADLDGVHLPAGGDVAAARGTLGPHALIGLSVHSVEEARRLDAFALDYAIAGPVFGTDSKPGYGPALGPAGLAAIARTTAIPIIAIGGITTETVADITLSNLSGLGVMGGVMRQANPQAEIGALLQALKSSRH